MPNSITYSLGSINFYNYSPSTPIYTSSTLSSAGTLKSASNRFYLAGSNLSGTNTFKIKLDSGVALTVLVR